METVNEIYYKRMIAGKDEYIKRLVSENNELHKDVARMGRVESENEKLRERSIHLWLHLADTIWAEAVRHRRANRRKWRAR